MNANVQFTVNGKQQRVLTDSRRTLLDVIREDLGLTGTKFGCGEGQCRACPVLPDGQPVRSCQVATDEVRGTKLETIESLANGRELHPLQEAFIRNIGAQCGYCTPGQIMAAKALLIENPKPTRTQVAEWLSGNICRCGAYGAIAKSILEAAKENLP